MKKKAFTLTELLVVVVIIGTLAAVVLPKFTQVLESRRTTEAENIMRAVRSEQEARCTLDKSYTAQPSELASFPAHGGSNYTYVLNDRGISAVSTHKNYTLLMPSYRTGEICCDGDDCGSLGKGYSACIVRVVADECAATDVPAGPEPEPEPGCQLKDYERSCSEVLNNDNWSGTIEYIVNDDCTGHTEKKFCSCALPAKSPEPCGAGQTGNITWTIDSENCTYVKQENCTQQVCEEGDKNEMSLRHVLHERGNVAIIMRGKVSRKKLPPPIAAKGADNRAKQKNVPMERYRQLSTVVMNLMENGCLAVGTQLPVPIRARNRQGILSIVTTRKRRMLWPEYGRTSRLVNVYVPEVAL